MDPNERGGLSSYYQPQQIPQPLSAVPPVSGGGGGGINASPNNGGVISNPHGSHPNPTALASATSSSPMAYSNTAPSAVSAGLEGVKKRRGRPRKYATPEEAAAAKRQSSASNSASAQPKKKQHVLGGLSSKLDAQVTAGEKFTPHVISVSPGEDIYHKIISFMQQLKGEMVILSVSGQVSTASVNHSATTGGSLTLEGVYNINSLNGSYVRTEHGRSGGLSINLTGNGDSYSIGGAVAGPLIAHTDVQVLVGTFVMDRKKDNTAAETSAVKSPSPVGGGTSMSGLSFRSPNDPYQNYTGGSSQYMNNMQ